MILPGTSNPFEFYTGQVSDTPGFGLFLTPGKIIQEAESVDLTTGLVAYYKFDNAGNRGLDSSSSGYNLTSAGTIVYNTGKFGSAARFTASNSRFFTTYASAPNIYFSTGSFSICAWINVDATVSGNIQFIFNHSRYQLRINADGKIRAVIFDGTTTINRDGTIDYSDDNWHHIVMVINRDDNLVELWSDGAFHNSSSIASLGTLLDTASSTSIGNRAAGSTQADDGDYDEIMVYNKRLQAEEIEALYNGGAGFQPI